MDDLGVKLVSAISQNDPDLYDIRVLLENGADVNTVDHGKDLMQIAISHCDPYDQEDIVELLVEFGFDLNQRNSYGQTRLIRAVVRRNLELVKSLVRLGADINATDSRGTTPLTHAARSIPRVILHEEYYDYLKIARFLSLKNANGDEGYRRMLDSIEAPDIKRHNFPGSVQNLHNQIDDIDYVNGVIKEGVDVDEEYDEFSALGRACKLRLTDTVRALLKAGASVDKPYGDGWNPLMTSASVGDTTTLALLLREGADITYKSSRGNALMVACANRQHDAAVALIEAGIDIDDPSDGGYSCVHAAVVNDDYALLEVLIKRGARVNNLSEKDVSPLMMTRLLEKREMFGILSRNGAIISSQPLGNTFSETDLLESMVDKHVVLGRCENVDHVLLEDGRCVHFATRLARRALLRLLNADVDPDRYVFPIQSSGTCWFFTFVATLFLSDSMRRITLPLRRSMIMGRTSPDAGKLPRSTALVFLKLNILIQAILLGNTNGSVLLPHINNEEVVLGLYDNNIIRSTLNCGMNVEYDWLKMVKTIVETLSDTNDSLPGLEFETLSSSTAFTKEILGQTYVADCVAIYSSKWGHVISGLTLGGERYIYDSMVGRIKTDWARFFENQEEVFQIGERTYTFAESDVIVMYVS